NWQTWTRDAKDGAPALTVTFDGAGRFVCERILPFGLKEQMICDGQTLWHLYPQLQIGAKRTMTPHHRAALAALFPWCAPPVEDLARNADFRVAGPGSRSDMIVPHYEAKLFEYIKEVEKLKKSDPKKYERLAAPEWHRVHLIVADDGRLLERQIVHMPDNKLVASQLVERDGRVRFLDKEHKEVLSITGKLSPAQPPNLTPDTKGMVVLPLPYRAAAHVQKALKLDKRRVEDLRFEEGLQLFGAHVGAGNGDEAQNVFQRCFDARDQRQLGFYVFLAACKRDNADAILSEYPDEPLAQYVAVHSSPVLRKHAAQWEITCVHGGAGLLQPLRL